MKANGLLFAVIAAFVGIADIVYWFTSHDATGTTCLALTFGLFTLMGYYLLYTARRIGTPAPQDRADAAISDGAGEVGFFSPHSVWPPGIALAFALVLLGPIFGYWLSVMGFAGLAVTIRGLLFEYVTPEGASEQ